LDKPGLPECDCHHAVLNISFEARFERVSSNGSSAVFRVVACAFA
jgi:hypothetical protein